MLFNPLHNVVNVMRPGRVPCGEFQIGGAAVTVDLLNRLLPPPGPLGPERPGSWSRLLQRPFTPVDLYGKNPAEMLYKTSSISE